MVPFDIDALNAALNKTFKFQLNNLLHHFTIERNAFLDSNISAYYRYEHQNYKSSGTLTYINYLKNDFNNRENHILQQSIDELLSSLGYEILQIMLSEKVDTVCVVPRAKTLENYNDDQLLFYKSLDNCIEQLRKNANIPLTNGLSYIKRHTDTRTTHFKDDQYGGNGKKPYRGITKDTCYLSDKIKGKNILLIDDIYTKTANVDEDCIQALLDKGAKRVVFFAIGYTQYNSKNTPYNTWKIPSKSNVNVTIDYDDEIPF